MKKLQFAWILAGVACLLCGKTRADDADATVTTISTPAPLTMHMDGVHPQDALQELTKQTGVSLQVWPDQLYQQNRQLPTSITVNADAQTFWTVLGSICEQAHLSPANINNNSGITFQQSDGRSPFGSRPQSAGPQATIVVESIQRNHTISYNDPNPQVQKNCGVQLNAYVDPRVRMLKYQTQVNVDQADDENGQSIALASNDAPPNFQDCNNGSWQANGLNIPLNYDPQVSHKLATLKGSVRIMSQAEVSKIEFSDLSTAANTGKEAGGLKVFVDEVGGDDHSISVKIRIVRLDMPKEIFRNLFGKIFQEGRFETADGKATRPNGGGGGSDDSLSYTLNANYSNDADKPTKLIWEIPTRIEQIDLPFEFHDLVLP